MTRRTTPGGTRSIRKLTPALSGRRWAVVAVSAAAMGGGTGPPFLIGYLGPALRTDLMLSRTQIGLLIGVFYGLCGLGSLLAARIAEPLGARRCVLVDLVLVAASLVAVLVTPSFWLLAVAMAVTGAGYALVNAGTSMAVAGTAPPGRAGQDLTVKTAGVPLMATLLALVGPAAALHVGWQGVAGALAAVAVVVAAATSRVLPARSEVAAGAGPADSTALVPATPAVAVRAPGSGRRLPDGFVLLPVAAFLFIAGSQPLLSWLVLSLTDAGLSAATAGRISAAGTAIGIAGMILVSRLADRIGPGRRSLAATVLALTTATGVGLLWLATDGPLTVVVVGAVIGLLGNLGGAGTIQAVVVDRVPWAVGRAIGLMSAGYYLGALVSPWVFGAAADATGGYDLSWGLCAAALLASAACFVLVHRRIAVPGGRGAPAEATRPEGPSTAS